MMYEPMAAKTFTSSRELKAAYSAGRNKMFDDMGLMAALRATLEREKRERAAEQRRHAEELADLKAEIDDLRLDKAQLASQIAFMGIANKEEERPNIDRVKYAFPKVLAAICRAHNLTPAEIKSPSRRLHCVRARMHLINVISVHRPDLSTPVIGSLLNRDHTTVINARYRWPHVKHKVAWAIVAFEREIERQP